MASFGIGVHLPLAIRQHTLQKEVEYRPIGLTTIVVVFYFTSTARYIKVFELVMVELRSTCRTQEYKAKGEMSGVQMSYNALSPTNTLYPLEPYFVFI